jgi:hypothetical protein
MNPILFQGRKQDQFNRLFTSSMGIPSIEDVNETGKGGEAFDLK